MTTETTYRYDESGRLVEKAVKDGCTVETTTWEFDSQGRVVREVVSLDGTPRRRASATSEVAS